MKIRVDISLLAAAWLGQADGFYTGRKNVERKLEELSADVLANVLNEDGTINQAGLQHSTHSQLRGSATVSNNPVMYQSLGENESGQSGEEPIHYPGPATISGPMNGVHSMMQMPGEGNSGSGMNMPGTRSGKGGNRGNSKDDSSNGSVDENPINTPQSAIDEAHENDIMILSSDYMYVSNCLLRKRHATDPVRQRAFELFKQTAAGDWFIVFGYVCGDDWACWKKNVQNLLAKKGEEYGGGIIGRCVSRLVREKAEGLRTRRRREITEGGKITQQIGQRRKRDLGSF